MTDEWQVGWRLRSTVSVKEAALLIVNTNPDLFEKSNVGPDGNRPAGFDGLVGALFEAISEKRLISKIISSISTDRFVAGHIPPGDELRQMMTPDPQLTMIAIDDLKLWLKENNVTASFFAQEQYDPLNSAGQYYAPKLAAAIQAWKAIAADESAIKANGNVKQAIEHWLAHHSEEFDLSKNGKINQAAFEQISAVTNWLPEGGRISTRNLPSAELKKNKRF